MLNIQLRENEMRHFAAFVLIVLNVNHGVVGFAVVQLVVAVFATGRIRDIVVSVLYRVVVDFVRRHKVAAFDVHVVVTHSSNLLCFFDCLYFSTNCLQLQEGILDVKHPISLRFYGVEVSVKSSL